MNVDDEDKVADVLDETNDAGSDSDEKIMLTTKEAGEGGGRPGGWGWRGGEHKDNINQLATGDKN